ncbi:hypothetical protein LCGC14_1630890 [marine sediment metagenome]|uniref:Uncharacterized protein n=1 Tax=marine sediment metagenome TaxID=412755 RepID=A0A0F9I2N6_9ZZZZ
MQKNVAGQKWVVYAWNTSSLLPVTGDAANITANLRIDGGAANPVDDTNPTELEDGYYIFDITQTESNGDLLLIAPASATGSVRVRGVPEAIYTSSYTPGDFAVTLTIRTVGETSVSGISVWVNSSNSRSGSVAGTKVTDTNGQVVFNLEYTTYYIFCNLSGYTFASASFTASAGNVSFTKNIATATSAGSSAFYTDSFLSRAIVDVRESSDEPTQAAKYTDARIIEHLEKAYIIVLNEVNRNSRTPAVAKIQKTIVSGTTAYILPHTVGSVHGVYKGDPTGGKVFYDSRSKFNAFGRGIWFENQTLHIQTTELYGIGTALTIEYVPSGIARLHNGIYTVNADGDVVTFGATPNAGTLDTHHEAYAGSIFRSLGSDGTGNYLQERVITAYDELTREATLDVPLDPIPTGSNLYYEIAPAINKGMDTVVALYAAWRLVSTEGNTKRASGILKAYRNALRNVRLTAYYSYMPEAPIDRSDNLNNRRYLRY